MTTIKQKISTQTIAIALSALLLIIAGYFGYTSIQQKEALASLSDEKQGAVSEKNTVSQTLLEAQDTIAKLEKELTLVEEDLEEVEDDYRREKKKNSKFEDQINALMGTVGDLDKLAKIDEELLQKYSKVYFLNENYIPSKIREIDDDYILTGRDAQYFHGDALPSLEKMIDRAERSDIDIKVLSAYRSFDTQAQLKGAYTQTYGSGANAFSADQGYSEHQLGTTLDLTDVATGGPWLAFENTDAYAWLEKNAYKYGFVLSYPKDNGFYIFEPWHWRFVGEDLADYLHDEDLNFYDMEQREIDSYLIKIFD